MNKLADKAVVLALCIISLVSFESVFLPVIAFLAVIALSAISQSFSDSRISLVTEILSGALCFVNPAFLSVAPVFLYDFFSSKRYWLSLTVPLALIVSYEKLSSLQLMLLLGTAAAALMLWRNTSRLEDAEKKLISVRDNSEEMNIQLSEKNKQLCENQDYEINLATMNERNRIAREIHDNVGHMLTRSILQLGALIVINKDETMKEHLVSLRDTLDNAMTSIRSSVHNLHDNSIDLRLGVNEAIKPLEEKYHTETEFDFTENMPKNIRICFIGIVKECVSNVIKHSNGDHISVVVREHPGFYQLSFSDNGKCSGINDSGIGLSNMRERVSAVDGVINITPSESGFRVFVSVPKKQGKEN